MKYKAKPVTIEAVQFTGDNIDEIKPFCGEEWGGSVYYGDGGWNPTLYIETLEGEIIARVGDYIIKGAKGEFYLGSTLAKRIFLMKNTRRLNNGT